MKKRLVIFLLICILTILVKYYYSNYEITYKINDYNIYTLLEKNRVYFEIKNGNVYNFDIYTKSKKKIFIESIKELEVPNYKCILPIIKGYQTYPLCYDEKNDVNVDFNLINSEVLEEYKIKEQNIAKPEKDFIFYNNLNDNEYVALWTYKGYTLMNKEEYKNIIIFEKDRYDNDLAFLINDNIYMPNYDQKYEYDELIIFNIISGNISKINLNKKIDYDSYVVGNIKNKLYIFDNKSSILYSINIKNGEIEIMSSDDIGYYKYQNGKFIKCDKTEYKIDKIKYNNTSNSFYKYIIDKEVYKVYNENKNVKTRINDKSIIKIFEKDNDLYYVLDNSFYKYNPINGNIKIFYDYELSFNNSKAVFMYYK